MRTICFLLFPLIIFSAGCKKDCDTPPPANTECKVELDKGLLAYYPFNGNANDASGNDNNGTPMNGAFFTTDYLGRANRAAGFDGVDDYIIVNDGSKFNADTITISLIVMVNNTNRRHTLVGKSNFSDATGTTWGVGQSFDGLNKWEFSVHNNDCASQYVYNSSDFINSSEAMQSGRWYHILSSFANGKQSIYVDGKLRTTVTREFKNLKKCNSSNFLIGGWWQKDIISIDGKIDEIRIYKRLLNDCEISNLSSGFGENNF